MSVREDALRFLYKELRLAKTALSHAESKPNVTGEELENLRKKIRAVDWLTPLAIKAEDEDDG